MERERTPQDAVLDRLIAELGLLEGTVPNVEDVPSVNLVEELTQPELRAWEERVLGRTMEWIGFLEGQSEQLAGVAMQLYKQLADGDPPPVIEFAQLQGDSRAAVVDRLEWTLAALEYWIEEQKPPADGARFCIRWTDGDGLAAWRGVTGNLTDPTSVRAVVQDGAETEGEFSPSAAEQIAALVVSGLRSGDVKLLRLRRIDAESSPEAPVFELVPRGEAFKAASVLSGDRAGVLPAEVEARLAHGESRALAAILDEASYANATATVSAHPAATLEADLLEGINRIATSCNIEQRAVVQVLLSLTNQRLTASIQSGNHDATLRLGRAITALAAFALQELRT